MSLKIKGFLVIWVLRMVSIFLGAIMVLTVYLAINAIPLIAMEDVLRWLAGVATILGIFILYEYAHYHGLKIWGKNE